MAKLRKLDVYDIFLNPCQISSDFPTQRKPFILTEHFQYCKHSTHFISIFGTMYSKAIQEQAKVDEYFELCPRRGGARVFS